MKKRTLVCFLIFTLCVFYISIPNTVFGQEEASLATQVLEKHSATFQRADIRAVLPQVLEALKAPEVQDLLSPAIISAAIQNPSLLAGRVPPEFITLLEEDQEIKDFLGDAQVQELLQDPAAIDELAALLAAEPEQPEPPVLSLAQVVLANHSATFQRADIRAVLPQVLEALKAPEVQDLLSPAIISAAIQNPSLLAGRVPPEFITLLEEDQEIKDFLGDAQVQELLQDPAAIDELAALLAAGATEPEVTVPEVTEPEVTVPEVTEPEVTVPEVTEPEVTEPEVTEPEVTPPPPVDMVEPFESTALTNLSGKSRLGGLSLNNASARAFVENFIAALAPDGITLEAEVVVDAILDAVPNGYLPKKQIRQILLSKRLTAFPKEAGQLDPENFGNAITPNFADFLYTDFGEAPNQKYLTSDGLHVYTRVPAKVAGVEFSLSDGTTVPGTEVTMDEFQADTIPYTFRLEETLAATNLPAWPGLANAQLFSEVRIRYSTTGPMGDYLSDVMVATDTGNGVVWEKALGIPPRSNSSIFYYFEVVLAEPLLFTALDRDAIAALDPTTVTLADIFNPANLHKIRIDGWAMPDPRNLQLVDRGIVNQLFTPDLATEFSNILTSPQVIDVVAKALAGQQVNINEILNAATPQQLRRIQNILLRNTNALTTQFENEFDPMLASVFTLPRVDLETHSLWTARIDNIADGNYQLKADVLDADGTVLDRIQENITVDTSAPEGGINIGLGENVTGYQNGDVFIATVPTAGTAGMLNISGTATDVGPGSGYLFYQMIGLNEDGTPYFGEPSTQRPNTWMPLTVDSTMLVSNVWEAVQEAVAEGRIDAPSDPILQTALALPLSGVLGILNAGLLQQFAGPFLKGLEPYIGFSSLSDSQAQLIVDALGATIDIVDHLVPVTFDVSDHLVMPIQGENMPLLVGDYGIRAMGIDTLFNVGAYATPTHLRIVAPVYDKATVTAATIADQYRVGEDGYEIGTIYANTTEGVMLTGTIERTPHPVTVLVQYEDASGTWADIGPATVMDDGTFEISWTVSDFDALLAAGATVNVQAIATNALQLTDPNPTAFSINLDAGDYPPMVLALAVDEMSITSLNPDSEGPQGTVTINAYTLDLTGPPTVAVRFEATQDDGEPIELGIANQSATPTDLVDAVQAAIGLAAGGTDASVVPGDYLEWSLTVDTATLLEDTITKDSPGARDHTKDVNPYTIRAFAVSMDEMEWPSDATTMLSVDNVDDVGPLGPTNITTIANVGGMVEADTHRGLVDENDPSVVPQSVTLTIEPTAVRKTYTSVMLVSVPEINAALISDITETAEGSGVFMVTVDIGALGIEGNGTYKLHALVDDEPKNGQVGESPERTVHVKNYLRPDPAVFKIAVDDGTGKNADSEGSQGTFMFTGYTIEQNSPPIMSIRLEAKRANDTTWTPIGTGDASTSVAIEDAALPGVLDHLAGIAVEGTEAGNRSVVAIDATYREWAVSVDTIALGLADSITNTSPGARDVSLDDNPYTVRAFAVDGSGKEWASDATEMFSLDNVDDVAPLGPTNVSVTSVEATDNMVFEDAGDGSYTVGGLVDKYDDAVNSPVATFTVEPTAARKTYASVRFVPGVEGLVIADVTETAEGSGVFTVTVDVGTLADMETYLENGTYMFHALAFDEFGNEQADDSETDGSKISVTVANTYRPAPQVLTFTVGDPTQTNPDSGAPQGTISLYGYSPEITSAPTTSVVFEVKRKNDTEWKAVGTASESSPVTAADDAKLAAADVADVAGENVVTSDTYQRWMIEVDTTTLEDSITADSPGARDHTKDDNQYMVRATAMAEADGSANLSVDGVTAMFSVDNVDDVAPLGPTNVSVTSVDAIDSVLEAAEDGSSYTVGGLVDKYDEAVLSPVATFTLKPTADRKTYKSVRFVTDIENLVVTEVTETAEGSGVFTVTVDVGTLADMKTYLENGTYMFHALAFDEFANEQADDSETDGSKISVTVENSYRPAPEVLAIAVDPESITQTNPDSGAPQGTITLHSYSHEISSPPTTAVRFEVKRPSDAEWIDVGTATESSATEISDATLTDVVDDLAHVAVSATEAAEGAEGTVVPISRNQMWTIEVDTTTLEDTITAESPAARDASKDDNQYMVRAVAIAEADGSETLSADGVTAMFSVDNVDDVPPVGPTNIVAVADVAGMIAANEDGSYTVGGIVDDTVPTPIAIFTTEPTADPITYASVNLVQTAEDAPETTTEGEAGALDITIDVGLLENGTYMFHALAVDEFGNVQTDESPMITVHVLNFRVSDVTDLAVIAVDGTDVPEPPAEPIPLRESVTVSFMVANDSLAAEELSGAVDGSAVPSESAEDPENTFSLMVEVGALVDGVYTPDGVVTKRNGSVAFPITTVNVDNTGPMVTIESPTEDETVDSLPTLRATYHDGAGSGVDGATGSLALARLQPNEVEVVVDQAELEKDAASLVYTRREELAGGAYRVTVQVTDNLGNVGEGSAEFAVNGTAPMVAIHSPAAGQTFEHGEPLISGEFSGTGTVEVTTFTINDVDATPEVDGNQFSYTPEEALANGDYKVVVAVTDGDGNTAQTSVVFMVDIPEPPKDTTPPVISSVAPTGILKDANLDKLGAAVISAVVTDEQSAISSVKYSINGGLSRSVSNLKITEGKIEAPVDFETHGPGLYTVRLIATSQGGTTEHTWTFTLVVDNVKPTITSITPSGTFRGGLPVISASASDDSGVGEMSIIVMDSDGEEVEGNTEDDGEDGVEGITRLDFNPEVPLDEGTYTIEVRATDTLGNSATAKGNFTIDFDTAAPVITMASPQNEARLTNRRPQISITYADAESGIDIDSIRFVFDDKLINLTPNQKSASQVRYTPSADLAFGQHTVKLEVSDMAHKEGNVSEKSDGARQSNMAVHEFSFTVESEEGPVLASRPINAPNPFKENTRISFTLTRQSTVSIAIYDMTGRRVRVLADNEVWDAGEYIGKAAIGWDGTTTGGEDLARGIYFCQIIVSDGFEPEYAILKLALTR